MKKRGCKKQNSGIRKFIYRFSKSRWYRTLVLRFGIVTVCAVIAAATCFSMFFTHTAQANDGSDEVYYKYYHRIEICEGDTLWSIAKDNFLPQEQTVMEYIKEVQQINHLSSTEIFAGEQIMIPYYSTEFH